MSPNTTPMAPIISAMPPAAGAWPCGAWPSLCWGEVVDMRLRADAVGGVGVRKWQARGSAQRRLQGLADHRGDIVTLGIGIARHARGLGRLVAQLLQGHGRLGDRI